MIFASRTTLRKLDIQALQPRCRKVEVVTLALVGQWGQFKSERAYYRYAERHVRAAFPTLPDRAPVQSRASAASGGVGGVGVVPGASEPCPALPVRMLGRIGHSQA